MGKNIYERYDSIASLMKTLEERKENNKAMKSSSSSQKASESFTGTKNYDEAVNLITTGWTEKLDEVKSKFDAAVKSNSYASIEKSRPATGVVGYAPCVPNAIRGLPNSMIMSERVQNKVKAVSIVYGISVDAGWKTEEMIECGITVLKLVNRLELDGYRVRLVLEAMATSVNSDTATVMINVKDYRQQLDLKKLCFPIIHPSMLRRICFKWLETVPNLTNSGFSSGYGRPLGREFKAHAENVKNEYKYLEENEYYINAYMVREYEHDVKKIMDEAGMAQLRKG